MELRPGIDLGGTKIEPPARYRFNRAIDAHHHPSALLDLEPFLCLTAPYRPDRF